MQQTQITDRIKFGYTELPPYPMIWSHDTLIPVTSAQQYESIRQFEIRDKYVYSEIKKLVKPLVKDGYDIDYFRVKQKLFKEADSAAITFHTWYYKKTNESDDMSEADFKTQLTIGIVAVSDYIAPTTLGTFGSRPRNGVTFNSRCIRDVHVRKMMKMPRNENSFKLTAGRENVDIAFVSVAYNEEIKKAVVTLHIVHLY